MELSFGDMKTAIEALSVISSDLDRLVDLSALKNSQKAEKGRGNINELAQKYLSDTNPKTANATMFEFMTQALKFFKMMGAGSAERNAFIESLETEHRASHERFQQMVSVAFDDEGIEGLKKTFERAGFEQVSVDVVHTGTDILAWSVNAQKPM